MRQKHWAQEGDTVFLVLPLPALDSHVLENFYLILLTFPSPLFLPLWKILLRNHLLDDASSKV